MMVTEAMALAPESTTVRFRALLSSARPVTTFPSWLTEQRPASYQYRWIAFVGLRLYPPPVLKLVAVDAFDDSIAP